MGKRFAEFLEAVCGEQLTRLPSYVFDMLQHIGELEGGFTNATCGPVDVDANGAPV